MKRGSVHHELENYRIKMLDIPQISKLAFDVRFCQKPTLPEMFVSGKSLLLLLDYIIPPFLRSCQRAANRFKPTMCFRLPDQQQRSARWASISFIIGLN